MTEYSENVQKERNRVYKKQTTIIGGDGVVKLNLQG